MANVPRVTRRVFTEALPGVRRTAAETAASAGVGIAEAEGAAGEAIVGVGRTIGAVGHVVSEIARVEREKADQTALLEADNYLSSWESQAVYDPEKGALTKRGKDAMGVPEAVGAEFEKRADAIQATLQPGQQQQAFAALRSRRRAQLEMTLRRHTFTEVQRYQVGELEAFVSNKRDSAIANAADPRRVAEDVDAAVAALKAQGPRLGMSPEQLEAQVAAVRSQAYGGVIDRLLSQDQVAAARAYYAEVKDQVKGEALAKIEKALEAGTLREQAQDQTERIIAAHPGDLAKQRAAAKEIEDRKVRDETIARLEHEWSIAKRAEDDERRSWNVQARQVLDRTGDWRELAKLPFWSQLDTQEIGALRTYAEHRVRKIPVETNQARFYELIQAATSSDPAVRAKFYDPQATNLMKDVDKLSAGDWEQLVQLQTVGAAQLTREQHGLLVNQANQNRIVDEAVVAMGYDPRPPDPGAKGFDATRADFVNNFRREVRETVQRLEMSRASKGALATATDEEVQAIVDRLRIPIGQRMVKDNWGPWNTYADRFAWEVKTFDDIPRTIVEEIKRDFYAANRPVSKQAILDAYRADLAGVKPASEGK